MSNAAEAMRKRAFVVLDRDGTIIVERHYLSAPDQVELIPGVGPSLLAMSRLGLGLLIVTNQSGIGRGYFDQARLEQVHNRLRSLLKAKGVQLDAIYFCPHLPEDSCSCRKPETGMMERAVGQIGLDPSVSYVVGDNQADIELGRRMGATTLLVRTGYGAQTEATAQSDYVVDDITGAASIIQQLVERKQGR